MKIRSYKNSTVALIEKTSHGKSRIQAVELDPKNTSGGTEKWMVTGPQIIVPSKHVEPRGGFLLKYVSPAPRVSAP